jgi:hypothetical protein
MWKFIDLSLMEFRTCFTREAAFGWFIVVVVGLMIRNDHLGVTSIIRVFGINPNLYECLIHFFYADSWILESIQHQWIVIVMKSGLVYRVNGKPLLIVDGVKQSKEACKMPCVKKLTQESENSAKPQYIHGHMFCGIGVLLGSCGKFFCTLLSLRIHDGNEIVGKWINDKLADVTHVVRAMIESAQIASYTEPSILVADRYFLSAAAIKILDEINKQYVEPLIMLVTKAKKNATAYEKPLPRAGKGRSAKKGKKIKLQSLFSSARELFRETEVEIYGKKVKVEYLVKDLLWGYKLYRELRFVLVKYDNTESILVTTDLTMLP